MFLKHFLVLYIGTSTDSRFADIGCTCGKPPAYNTCGTSPDFHCHNSYDDHNKHNDKHMSKLLLAEQQSRERLPV
jgi:hypothetical protein